MNAPIRAYLQKRKSGQYQARFYCKDRSPKQKYFALGTSDPSAARQTLGEWERDVRDGEWDPWTEDAPEAGLLVSEAVERFLAAKKRETRATTARAYKSTLEAFSNSLEAATMLEHVTKSQCKAFYLRTEISRTSRNTYGRQIRAFFNWCVKKNLLKRSPMKEAKIPKAPSKVPTFLTREQYKHLLETIDGYATVLESDAELSKMLEDAFGLDVEVSKHANIQEGEIRWLVDMIVLACGTGMRSGEVRSMRWDWIDFGEGTITIQETEDFRPKNGDERVIYVTGDALAMLERRYAAAGEPARSLVFIGTRGEKINKDYLGKRFRFFRDLAKLPKKLNFHSTRHTYASWLVQNGVDLYRVQKLCGHKSMQTTMRYAHLAPKNLKDAVQQTFGG